MIPHEAYRLGNGLRVILAPDPSTPLVAVDVWYHVGTGCEEPGRSGFAHLFEHMMFQGSRNVGADHFKILKQLGAEIVNGHTNNDRTKYFEVVPSNQLETALWLESDRMGHFLDVLDAKRLQNQIDVVRNERRQTYETKPYTRAAFARFERLFPEGHPYRYLTIGRHEDLERASLDDVTAFFQTWYVPANATLVMSGDFELPRATRLVEKWFGTFPASTKPEVMPVPAPIVSAQEIIVDDAYASLPEITFSWHTPARYAAGDAELAIVGDALGRDGLGRLTSLIYDSQLAQHVRAFQDSSQFSSVFDITVTVRSDAAHRLDEVKHAILDEIVARGRDELTAGEIARAVANYEAYTFRGFETPLGRAERLAEHDHYLGVPDRTEWDLARWAAVTPAGAREAVAAYLRPDNATVSITIPARR